MKTYKYFPLLAALLVCVATSATHADDTDGIQPTATNETTVTLLSAGDQPREVLRYRPTMGAKSDMEFLTRLLVVQRIGEVDMPPTRLPSIELHAQIVVDDISLTGDITYLIHYKTAKLLDERDMEEPAREPMLDMIKWMEGATGRAVISNRGVVHNASIEFPEGLSDSMKARLETMAIVPHQFAAPFPEEAIGPGAKWRVDTTLTQSGVSTRQSAVYTFFAKRAGMIGLEVELTQDADEQPIESPGAPPARLTSHSGSGTGMYGIDLTQVLPRNATLQLLTDTNLASGRQEMGQKVDSDLRIAVRPSEVKPVPAREDDESAEE